MPVTFTGDAPSGAVVTVSFGGTEKTVEVSEDSTGWKATFPAFEASSEPRAIKAVCSLKGEVIAEATAKNVLVGEVWYVVMPETLYIPKSKGKKGLKEGVRFFAIGGKSEPRFSYKENRYHMSGSAWYTTDGKGEVSAKIAAIAKFFGNRIAEKTSGPVGLIVLDIDPKRISVSSWLAYEKLNETSSLTDEFKNLHSVLANNQYFDEEVQNYLGRIEEFLKVTAEDIKRSGKMPEGDYKVFYRGFAKPLSQATLSYNSLVAPYLPAPCAESSFTHPEGSPLKNKGAYFGPEFSALANSMKKNFGGDPWLSTECRVSRSCPKQANPRELKERAHRIQWMPGWHPQRMMHGS